MGFFHTFGYNWTSIEFLAVVVECCNWYGRSNFRSMVEIILLCETIFEIWIISSKTIVEIHYSLCMCEISTQLVEKIWKDPID